MEAARSFQSCARRAWSQPTKRQLYISSNHPRSTTIYSPKPALTQTRSNSSTPSRPQVSSKQPFPRPTNPMDDLIRDVKAEEPKRQSPSATNDLSGLLSIARETHLNTPRSSTLSSPQNPTLTTSQALNNLTDELADKKHDAVISLRLRPTLGRTVDGLHGDPTRGFRTLERKCNENSVRMDFRSQEKHIRRGQRRKNQRIVRWRRLFMEGFKSELDTIQRMRRQGW